MIRLLRTLRAEWTKALSLPSIIGALVAAIVVPPALAVASGLSLDPTVAAASSFPIESHGFETAGFGQPLVILLAALVAGTEYSGGQLRTMLLADPRRGRVLAAKLVVVTTLAVFVGLLGTTAAVVLKHATLGEHGLSLSEFTAGMGWNLIGVSINYVLIGLIAALLTLLTRSIVVALAVLVPLVLGVTLSLLGLAPLLKYLPDVAGMQLLTSYPGVGLLDPIPGGIVMATWTVLLGIAGWLAFRARDTGGG
ncbi:ABC transporter permease [Labedella endophytica]|uniref:ABC transporter permease n=1 Tax=Labedella endophytica TaxID=1523160 RepID=A0A3S1CSN1_9MICO|nr:ABC transporter permease [Labedella endophytica]RUR01540.1 hypothetical protein ELQ94_08595 [Labedella endophytica]